MPSDLLKYYVLVGRTPIAVDMDTWGRALEDRLDKCSTDDPWRVGHTDIDDNCYVSTVFLGLNHNWSGRGDAILFETMIFGGPLDQATWRYCTYAEAERGHAEAVTQAQKASAQIKAIANAAGVKSHD